MTIWLACLALIWLPGAGLARLLRLPRPSDWLLRSSLEIGLGLSIWPLLLLWSTVATRSHMGPSWSSAPARIAAGAVCLASVALVSRRTLHRPDRVRRDFQRQWPWLLLFAILLALAWLTRAWHIRGLALPNWVDSIHHVLIVRLIVEQGGLPTTYAPYLADAPFAYHWGFHAWVAWLAWLLGLTDSFDLARLVLLFGQILNVLMLWMLYAAGRTLFTSRRAGFLAAALGMFVSWLPAYYTAWGRYTHLAGLLLAVPLLVFLWKLARTRTHAVGWSVAASLTAAALALTHVRIALFAAIWAALLLLFLAARQDWRPLRRWGAAGVLTLLLIAPWLVTLAGHPRTATLIASASVSAPSWQIVLDRIPWSLVWTPGMRELVSLATAGLSELASRRSAAGTLSLAAGLWLLLVAGILFWQRRTGQSRPAFPWRPLALIGGWGAAVFALLNADVLSLPRLAFLSLNSAAITLFLPAGLAAGGLTAWASGAITPLRWQRLSAFLLTAAVAVQGAAGMRDIINPQTVIATAEDIPALHWIRDNTPPDARFAVNARLWLGNTYAGTDAGYWIPVLADRQSILPPALYTLILTRPQVLEINGLLDAWTAAPDLSDPALIDRLRAEGVTHIYVGHHSARAQADALAKLPELELVYDRDSVYIFRIRDPQENSTGQNTP